MTNDENKNSATEGRSDSEALLGDELPGKNARAMLPLLEEIAERDEEISRLCAQRDAWKEVAEHHYGLLRVALYGDSEKDYPVTGSLDAWASGRYPILTPNK